MTPFKGKLKIRHLEVILAIAESGSLSKAAQQLHSTQSVISRSLAEIEEILAGRLYERTGKGMAPTALGEAACHHARVLLSALRNAEVDMAAIGRGERGSLVIGCFSLFSGWPLTEAVHLYRKRNPDVALTITIGTAEDLITGLDNGAIDVLLSRLRPMMNPNVYRAEALISDPILLTCSPHHPLAGQAVSLARCVAFPWITAMPGGSVVRELEKNLLQAGVALPATIGSVSLEFGRKTIRDNHHLWMLPGSVASGLRDQGEIRILPVRLDIERVPMAAIWRRDRPHARHIREFADALAHIVAQAQLSFD